MIEYAALNALVEHLAAVDMTDLGMPATQVFGRVLEGTDPHTSIGVFMMAWAPVSGPGIGSLEPDVGRYSLGVGTLVKASDRALGEQQNATFIHRVRNALYRHKPLLDALRGLSELGDDDRVERYQRSGVSRIDYTDSKISGGFAFVSQIDFFIETEVA